MLIVSIFLELWSRLLHPQHQGNYLFCVRSYNAVASLIGNFFLLTYVITLYPQILCSPIPECLDSFNIGSQWTFEIFKRATQTSGGDYDNIVKVEIPMYEGEMKNDVIYYGTPTYFKYFFLVFLVETMSSLIRGNSFALP